MDTCSTDGCNEPTYARGLCCAHYAKWKKARPSGTAKPRPAPADANPILAARTSLPELLAALAAALPPLPGARCRGHTDLFDRTTGDTRQPDTRKARTAALDLCRDCPALAPCSAWLDSLPADQRPIGVTACRIVTPDTTQSGFQREKAERDKRITQLHESGLASSEIAAITGCSKNTVLRAIRGRRQ